MQGQCAHPDECAERATWHRAYVAQNHAFMVEDHAVFLADLRDRWGQIKLSSHVAGREGNPYSGRQYLRAISLSEIVEVIECGEPIAWSYQPADDAFPEAFTLVLKGWVSATRVLHVVVTYGPRSLAESWVWIVKTAYDPALVPWVWTPDFTQRRCFCPLPPVCPPKEVNHGRCNILVPR